MTDQDVKRVAVVAGDRLIDVVVQPGTTPADVLADCELDGDFWLARQNGDRIGNNIFAEVNDGDKLVAVAPMNVAYFNDSPAAVTQVRREFVDDVIARLRKNVVEGAPRLITRNSTPYWIERGWKQESDQLVGHYRFQNFVMPGVIIPGRWPEFFIRDCERVLKKGPHGACFSSCGKGDDWFSIHFSEKPKSPTSGILAVENLMRETFRD